MNKLIMDALEGIVSDIQPDIYRGTALEYITFTYDESPDMNGDDVPDMIMYSVMVRYCCPLEENSLAKRKQIRQALASLGGTYPEVTNVTDEDGQQYVFTFEYADGDV